MNATSIPPRNRGPIVEEIIVEPNAVALPEEATATGPIVEESDLLPLKIIGLGLRTYAALYPERAHEMAQKLNGLKKEGLSDQEAGAAVVQYARDVIGPEVEAERARALAEQRERYRLIRDPKTRDSITLLDPAEQHIMEAELMKAENDAAEARIAERQENRRRMEAARFEEAKKKCQVC